MQTYTKAYVAKYTNLFGGRQLTAQQNVYYFLAYLRLKDKIEFLRKLLSFKRYCPMCNF